MENPVTPIRTLIAALATTLLGACSLIPAYERPAAPVPAEFPQAMPTEASTVAPLAADIGWRDYFADARLRQVIELALDVGVPQVLITFAATPKRVAGAAQLLGDFDRLFHLGGD